MALVGKALPKQAFWNELLLPFVEVKDASVGSKQDLAIMLRQIEFEMIRYKTICRIKGRYNRICKSRLELYAGNFGKTRPQVAIGQCLQVPNLMLNPLDFSLVLPFAILPAQGI